MTVVSFTVFGVAAPAGSKRALPAGGRPGARPIIVDASTKSRPWKRQVAQVAGIAMAGGRLLEGPLELQVRFYQPRPKSHYGSGKNAAVVKPSAPTRPTSAPDTTKLIRAIEDAMALIVYGNDAQIVTQHAEKHYGEPARAVIAVAPIQQ